MADMKSACQQSGRYQSASEGLRLIEDQDRRRAAQVEEVRRKIQVGLDELDRGEGIPGDQVMAELKQKSATLRRARKSE